MRAWRAGFRVFVGLKKTTIIIGFPRCVPRKTIGLRTVRGTHPTCILSVPNIMQVIDGSKGEGGGQIIRNAIVYATLFQVPLRIHSIRAKRSNPGLRAQHVTGLQLAVDICGGSLSGAQVGSNTFEYHPRGEKDEKQYVRNLFADIGTAGSICLLLQVGLPCLIYNSYMDSLELRGGTNADMAPQIDYMEEVLLPTISRHCIRDTMDTDANIVVVDIKTRGYYPIGKGVVNCSLHEVLHNFKGPMHPLILMERGRVESIHIKCFHAGKLPAFVASKMADAASRLIANSSLEDVKNVTPSVELVKHEPAVGSASGIIIVAKTSTNCIFGASSLGNRKEKAEITGAKAAQELLDTLHAGGCVDEWLQDQLILFIALAYGESKILTGCLTQHTQTAIDVAKEMTGAEFQVMKVDDLVNDGTARSFNQREYGKRDCIYGRHIISCKGIGFQKN